MVHFLFFLGYTLPCSIEWTIEFERFPISQPLSDHFRLSTFFEIKQKSASISKIFLQLLKEDVSPTVAHQLIDRQPTIWPDEFENAILSKNVDIFCIFFQNRFTQKAHFKKIPYLACKVWPGRGWKCVSRFARAIFWWFLNIFRTFCEKKEIFFRTSQTSDVISKKYTTPHFAKWLIDLTKLFAVGRTVLAPLD